MWRKSSKDLGREQKFVLRQYYVRHRGLRNRASWIFAFLLLVLSLTTLLLPAHPLAASKASGPATGSCSIVVSTEAPWRGTEASAKLKTVLIQTGKCMTKGAYLVLAPFGACSRGLENDSLPSFLLSSPLRRSSEGPLCLFRAQARAVAPSRLPLSPSLLYSAPSCFCHHVSL